MATKTVVEDRLEAIRSLATLDDQDLTKAPSYNTGIQEGTEVGSFTRKDAEKRLPQEGAIVFYIPKGRQADMAIAENVVKIAAKASSGDDNLWDLLVSYAEHNGIRFETKDRNKAMDEILRVSKARGRAIYDESMVKIVGAYRIETGIVFAHRPGQDVAQINEELILEPETESTEQDTNDPNQNLIPAPIINEDPAQSYDLAEMSVVIKGDQNNMAMPPTNTLERKNLPAINITSALEGASKIIAFIYEEDPTESKVTEAELQNTTKQVTSGETNQPVVAPAPGNFSFVANGPVNITYAPGALDPDLKNRNN